MNEHKESCRFIQVWITPDARGHTPQYGSSTYAPADRHNRLLQVLSGTGAAPKWPGLHSPHSIQLHQDVNVVVSETDAGVQHGLELSAGRQAYLLCMEGEALLGHGGCGNMQCTALPSVNFAACCT
jgi:redox-sensitive bicupin YhaK (pirin superfamily)